MRASRAIRATAWIVLAAGVAAPLLRRRLRLRAGAVLSAAGLAPASLCVAVRPSRTRQVALCALNMWAYLAAYELPHDDPERLRRRVRVDYPIRVDELLGLGMTPTMRLQRAFAKPEAISHWEAVLTWCHWLWFLVPHTSLGYILARDPERFASAAVRMYAVFDVGAVFYWVIPTAPPWWAAAERRLEGPEPLRVRRMMIEYGEKFWRKRWAALYGVLGGNPLAAMPSLHFATSLMAAHLLAEVGPVPGAVGSSYTALLGLALVYLGEHYAVDLIAGALLTETMQATVPRIAPRMLARTTAFFGFLLQARDRP